MKHNEVIIIGVAHKGKGGAILLTEKNELYYMDEIDSWEENVVGKKVRVTGRLTIKTIKENNLKNKYGGWKQGIEGDKKIIQITNWEIIE